MRSFAVLVVAVVLFPSQVSATATQSAAIAAEQSSQWTLRLPHNARRACDTALDLIAK